MSQLNDEQLEYVLETLHDIDFGTIHITIHEGKITQIDTTEKRRFSTKVQKKQSGYRLENKIYHAD